MTGKSKIKGSVDGKIERKTEKRYQTDYRTEGKGLEIDDNELDRVTGGLIIPVKTRGGQCPKCSSRGRECGKAQGGTLYKCESCGNTWAE